MEKAYGTEDVSTLNDGKTFDMISKTNDEKTFDLVNNLSNTNNEIPIGNLNPTLPEDFFGSPTDRSHNSLRNENLKFYQLVQDNK